MNRVLYLHGFASGPDSGKGRFFRERFAALGVPVDLPDLESGDFESLTLTRQLDVVDRCVRSGEPGVIIGSSLGGYLAALYAARHPGRFRLALLAPGFGFARRWPARLGESVAQEWRERGWMEVFHYGRQATARIGYGLVQDGLQYEDYPEVRDPVLVVHGVKDDVVPAEWSQEFAAGKPNVKLVLVDSDHELLGVLDEIWRAVQAFWAV